MRIRWSVVDSLLEVTKSTPAQLLNWLETSPLSSRFPCKNHKYLGKYNLLASLFQLKAFMYHDDEWDVYVPYVSTGVTIFVFWDIWRSNPKFRDQLTKSFKKRYKL